MHIYMKILTGISQIITTIKVVVGAISPSSFVKCVKLIQVKGIRKVMVIYGLRRSYTVRRYYCMLVC